MKALRFLGWLIVFLSLYLGFVILFQYGPSNFVEGGRLQWMQVQSFLGMGPPPEPEPKTAKRPTEKAKPPTAPSETQKPVMEAP